MARDRYPCCTLSIGRVVQRVASRLQVCQIRVRTKQGEQSASSSMTRSAEFIRSISHAILREQVNTWMDPTGTHRAEDTLSPQGSSTHGSTAASLRGYAGARAVHLIPSKQCKKKARRRERSSGLLSEAIKPQIRQIVEMLAYLRARDRARSFDSFQTIDVRHVATSRQLALQGVSERLLGLATHSINRSLTVAANRDVIVVRK